MSRPLLSLILQIFIFLPLMATPLSDVALAMRDSRAGLAFTVEGTVTAKCLSSTNDFIIDDGSICQKFWSDVTVDHLNPGDSVCLTGITLSDATSLVHPQVRTIDNFGTRTIPSPREIFPSAIESPENLYRTIRVSGMVRNAFVDEIDPNFIFVMIDSNGSFVCTVIATSLLNVNDLPDLIGSDVSVCGIVEQVRKAARTQSSHHVRITSADDLVVVIPSREKKSRAPELSRLKNHTPTYISRQSYHRECGTVIAAWPDRHLLLASDSGSIHRIDLLTSSPMPKYGQRITVRGFPETDLFHLNLSQADWVKETEQTASTNHWLTESAIEVNDLFSNDSGVNIFHTDYQGRLAKVSGTVCVLPSAGSGSLLMLNDRGRLVAVETTGLPLETLAIPLNSVVQVTGTVVMDIENWTTDRRFPHVTRAFIVPRRVEDFVVLKYPPWWTAKKIWSVVGLLSVGLIGVFLWNRSLTTLVTRRSRELLREQLGKAKSELKVVERTRLAVELHDSLAQSLAGVVMEIRAAAVTKGDAPREMVIHLDTASRALKSCQDELKHCLWDLRSQALEEKDMNAAIKKTLLPHLGSSRLVTRFNVFRASLSDDLTHAVLRIIRELVLNAIRHGQATEIRIAGESKDSFLKFSVADNGRGFSPQDRPSVLQGHFGLQGIVERTRQFGGTFEITSELGKGSKAIVTLKLS